MPSESQTTTASVFKITPVQLKPTQDILLVDDQRSATIGYIVGKLVVGKPGIPEVPGVVGRGNILAVGKPGDPNYQPFIPEIVGKPAVPAVAAVPDSIISVDSGSITMSDDEWKAWLTQDDNTYRAEVVAKRLSLDLAPNK